VQGEPREAGQPWSSNQPILNAPWLTPKIVTASSLWKLRIVVQMSFWVVRSSRKKVSVPLPPVTKIDPWPPSTTLVPAMHDDAVVAAVVDRRDEPVVAADRDVDRIVVGIDELLQNA
jgi:hypothetical protein